MAPQRRRRGAARCREGAGAGEDAAHNTRVLAVYRGVVVGRLVVFGAR